MRVELLGTGGFHPSEERHTACVLIPELGLMLDAGTAAFRVHRHAGVLASARLDVLVTHAHLDHIIGLTYLLGLERDGTPIETVVHAPPSTLSAINGSLLAPPLFPVTPVTRLTELGDTLVTESGARVTTFPLEHPGGSVGVRVESGGRSLAYVTDTTRLTDASLAAIRGVDVLLHEAHFDEANRELAEMTGHSTASDAAWAADQAEAGRLVLLHANPRATVADRTKAVAEAKAIRPEAEYARDGQSIEV